MFLLTKSNFFSSINPDSILISPVQQNDLFAVNQFRALVSQLMEPFVNLAHLEQQEEVDKLVAICVGCRDLPYGKKRTVHTCPVCTVGICADRHSHCLRYKSWVQQPERHKCPGRKIATPTEFKNILLSLPD
jgi:hypothetical protein